MTYNDTGRHAHREERAGPESHLCACGAAGREQGDADEPHGDHHRSGGNQQLHPLARCVLRKNPLARFPSVLCSSSARDVLIDGAQGRSTPAYIATA